MASTQSSSQMYSSIKPRGLNQNSHWNAAIPKQYERTQNCSRPRRSQLSSRPSSPQAKQPHNLSARTRSTKRRGSHEQRSKRRSLMIPVPHSRVALSPCLSSPSKINCSISRSGLEACQQALQKVQCRRPDAIKTQTQVEAINVKTENKPYTLSPSWCSPNVHNAAAKYNASKSNTQRADVDFLSVFLNNNGGYLDDSDDEDEEEEEDDDDDDDEITVSSIRANTVAFLRRIPSPFEKRRSSSLSSCSDSDIFSSACSTKTASDSSSSFTPVTYQRYWERPQPIRPVTPSPSRSRFAFFKK